MSWFELIAVLLVLAAGLSYLHHKLLRLPTTIGLMALLIMQQERETVGQQGRREVCCIGARL